MTRNSKLRLILVTACALSGCSDLQKDSCVRAPERPADHGAATESNRNDLRDVMQAKLTFANSLIGSIAVANFESVELNAMQLSWLSQRAEWHVLETPEYKQFSERFRQIADEMANHAQRKDLSAVAKDYSNLSASCIECHTYLRREGQVELPGLPQ